MTTAPQVGKPEKRGVHLVRPQWHRRRGIYGRTCSGTALALYVPGVSVDARKGRASISRQPERWWRWGEFVWGEPSPESTNTRAGVLLKKPRFCLGVKPNALL